MTDTQPPGEGAGGKQEPPETAQEWVDQATSQGTPPDFQPPKAPGQTYETPDAQEVNPLSEQPAEPSNGVPDNHTVIDTSGTKGDGLDKCPRCGSTEIELRPETSMLICHFCRHEWAEAAIEQKYGLDSAISDLRGVVYGSGASDIPESTVDVLTLKCQACGAEVVVNTNEAMQSRCHWCRNTLSVNQQLPNGAVPDGLLPFKITREDAVARIDEFVKKRKFFAHPSFVRDFAPTEVLGVYMPYLLVDGNVNLQLSGVGEIQTRSYTVKRGDKDVTLYDADVYQVARSFDLTADDLVLESSAQRADIDTSRNTNNIINAIQPFDVKEAVSYNANYMRGFTSERRDLGIDALLPAANDRLFSVGRARATETIGEYDRKVKWEREHLEVKGTRWVAVYLPVWLYSYYQDKGNGTGLVHYVAVNGRTGSTMGSVPVRQGRLIAIAGAIGVVGTIVGVVLDILTM